MAEPSRPTGRLVLVGTPIGHLEDITLRALRELRAADLIAAEDTRRTRKLLSHYDIHVPLTSCYQEIERTKGETLLRRLAEGQRIALVTDAGLPGISDPGAWLLREARARGFQAEVVPGPSAVLTALVGSGLAATAFSFHGFLAARSGERQRELEKIRDREEPQVFFVAPHRWQAVLEDALDALGDRRAVLCREMTKQHEEFREGCLSELLRDAPDQESRGEMTLVVAGAEPGAQTAGPKETPAEHLARLQREGLRTNQAVAKVARDHGLPRQDVYRMAHGVSPADKRRDH